MKFVVNRVHESSVWYGKDMQGKEVVMQSVIAGGASVKGYASGAFDIHKFCRGFTIAEVPDTEEGYYLL